MELSSVTFIESIPKHPLIVSAVAICKMGSARPDNEFKPLLEEFGQQVVRLFKEDDRHTIRCLQLLFSTDFINKIRSDATATVSFNEILAEARFIIQRITAIDFGLNNEFYYSQKKYDIQPFELSDEDLTSRWENAKQGFVVSYRKNELMSTDDKVFTIGSCFALEIKRSLRRRGFNVAPLYESLDYDLTKKKFGRLPLADTINHYDTYSIRREYERAANGDLTSENEIYENERKADCQAFQRDQVFSNPHRFDLAGATFEDALDFSRQIDTYISKAMRAARIHVITLGLIEVWRNPDTQKSYIIKPYKEIHAPSEFHLSSFEDNYRNLREVVEIIRSFGDDRQVLLSVSPVPLSSTFTKDDVVVANMRSKSTLRTVAAEIDKLYSNVHYVPSYEFVSKHNSYERDGIHVRRDAVEAIVDMTLDSYMKTN